MSGEPVNPREKSILMSALRVYMRVTPRDSDSADAETLLLRLEKHTLAPALNAEELAHLGDALDYWDGMGHLSIREKVMKVFTS